MQASKRQAWLPLFYVPNLIVLPLCPRPPAREVRTLRLSTLPAVGHPVRDDTMGTLSALMQAAKLLLIVVGGL